MKEPNSGKESDGEYSAVLQEENEGKQSTSCCSITTTRRSFRIIILLAIITLLIVAPMIIIKFLYTFEKFHVSTDKPLKFALTNCKLYIAEDASLPVNDIYLAVDVPGSRFSHDAGSVNEIGAHSNIGYTEACVADMQINPQAVLAGLEVTCSGTCYISQMGPHPLNLATGSLSVSGDNIDFMAVKVIAGQVQVMAKKGSLHIYSLTLTSNSGQNFVTSDEGDVVVQSLNSMKVSWSQDKNYVCMYAPQITDIGSSISTCKASKDESSAPVDCSSSYFLCKSSETCTSSTSAPTLALSSAIGNVYANVIEEEGVPVTNAMKSVRGWDYIEGLDFDQNMNRTLTDYIDGFNGSAKADPLIWISLGPMRSFSTAGMVFLLVANTAYLNAYPWWISFFSANLLLGGVYRIEGNLAPGICPFKTLPTTNDLYSIRELLLSRCTLFSGRADAAYVYGPKFPTVSSAITPSLGFRGTEGEMQLYGISFDGANYALKKYGLSQTLSLLLAVIISCILAFIMGCLMFYILLFALDKVVVHFLRQHKHLKEYTQRVQKDDNVSFLPVKPNQVADENAKNEMLEEEKNASILTLSQYMLIDSLVDELKRTLTSSVDEFCSALFVKLKPDDVDDFQPIRVKTLRAEYEKLCFLKQMPEEDLMSDNNKKKFQAKGFTFERPSNGKKGQEIEMLVKIRWFRDNEQRPNSRDIDEHGPDASLQKFFKSNCAVTPFEADKIEFEEFKSKYMEFCEHERLPIIVVTRAQLHDAFSIESITETPDYMVRAESTSKYKVDLDRVRKLNEELMEVNSMNPKGKALKSLTSDSMAKARSFRAFIYDIVAVALHFICLLLLGCILVVLPLFVELEISKYMISDYRYKLKYEDIMYAPWNIPVKLPYLSTVSLVCFIIAGVYLLMGVVELIVYYRYMSFPTQSLRDYMRMQHSLASKIVRVIEWGYICIVLSLLIMYLSLVAVWSVLGAILNPNAYLAYGAAAATFVSFVLAKITEFRKLNFMGIQALQEMLFNKLQGLLDDIMKKILTQAGFAAETVSKVTSGEGGLLERAERLVRNSSVGKTMVSMGIDPKDAIGVLSGDEEALIEIGVKQGVPKDVMKLLMAMIKGQKRSMIECLKKFANIPQLQIDPEIIQLAIDIITNNSDLNIPVLITNLSKMFFDIAYKQLMRGLEKEMDSDTVAYLDICKQIFPRLISAFRHFRAEEIDTFLEQYEGINEYLYDSVKKKAMALTTSKVKVFSKLFNEREEPKFALPSYVMKAVNVFKLVTMGEEGKMKGQSLRRIKESVFYIMENFFGADPKVTNMLNLLLSSTPEAMVGVDGKSGLISLEAQEKAIADVGDILKIPPTLVRFAWKMWTGNFTIDKDFVKEVCGFLSGIVKFKGRFAKPEQLETIMTLVLQFYNILNARLSQHSLIGEAQRFSIESNTAYITYLFGEKRIDSRMAETLLINPLFQSIAGELQVPVNQAVGLIALFRGNFSSLQVIELFDALRKRWNLPNFPSQYILSVLTVFVGNDENEIITSAQRLGLLPVEFVLVAKGLLHPGSISDAVFEQLGIRTDDPSVANRIHIPTNDSELRNEWIRSIKKLLSAEFKPIKAESQTPAPREDNKEGELKKADEKKSDDTNELLIAEEKKEPIRRDVKADPNNSSTFSDDDKKARFDAKLLLNINDVIINEAVIHDFLARAPFKVPISKKELDGACDTVASLLRALKDIKEGKTENQFKSAVNQIGELMNIVPAPLSAILSLIKLKDKKTVLDAIELLLSKVMSKHEAEEVNNFCTFILDKSKVLKGIEDSVTAVAEQLKIPKFLVKFALSPIESSTKSFNFGIEEFMMLLDQAGFNEDAFKKAGISFSWPHGKAITINELRFILSGLVVGNSRMVKQLLQKLGLPESILSLAFAMTSGNRMDAMTAIFEAIYPALEKYGVPRSALYTLLELYKFLDGLGSRPSIEPSIAATGYEYLKKKLGIVPEVLVCLEAIMKRDGQKLINEIPNLIRALYDLDRLPDEMRVKPEVISGLLTVLTGDQKSLENLAETMRIDQGLIELCLKLTNITKNGEDKVEKQLLEFQQSPLLTKVWSKLDIPTDAIDSILTLTFRTYNLENPNRLLHKLSVVQHVDLSFIQFILAITNSWASLQSALNTPMYRESEKRLAVIDDLKKFLIPVCKRLFINPELALVAIRIRQGDFYIIEDYQNYLNILLPSENVRKLAMGVCGILTLPVKFDRKFEEYPDQFKHALTFEGACEMLCELLNINPIVARIMMLDDKALDLIEQRFGLPKKALVWFVVTLINLPIFLLEGIALKECKKLMYLKELHLEEIMQELEKEEKKAAEKAQEENKADLNTLEEKKEEEKKEEEKKEEEKEGEGKEEAEADGSPSKKSETVKSSTDTKKFLRLLKTSLMMKTKQKSAGNYYDEIDFDTPTYEDTTNKKRNNESLSYKNEILEVLLFNMENHCHMSYEYITSKERREGAFMVSDERVLELFGTKKEYYNDMAEAFFENPKDPSNWLNNETLDLSKSWVHKDQRSIRKNVWGQLKNVFKAISMDPDITNKKKHKYDSITLGQLCLFMLLMRIRKRMNYDYNLKKQDNFYSLYAVECEALGVLLEGMTMTKGLFGPNFSRIRFYKVMSLALNANVANMVDHRIVPSMYTKDIFYNFKENYDNKEELKAAIDYCKKFDSDICKNTDLKLLNYLSFSEYDVFLSQPNDILDTESVAAGVSPYLYGLYNEGKPAFEYELSKDDPFVSNLEKAELEKRKKACVKPAELLTDEFKKATEDPISRQTAAEAERFMQFIETNFVIEQEKLDFLLDLALLQWNAFDNSQIDSILKHAGYKKNDNSPAVYKAIVGAASLRKHIHDWKLEYIVKKTPFATTVLDTMLPYLGKLKNEALIQSIVFLAHGVIIPSTIKDLAAKYGLDYNLVNAFFVSGYPSELLSDKKVLQKFMDPLLERLRLVKTEQRDLIYHIVDIYNGKIEGWEKIAEYCCFKQKKNARVIFNCILELIDWTKTQGSKISPLRSVTIDKSLTQDLPAIMMNILKFLIENETGKLTQLNQKVVMSFIGIVNGIIKRDLRQIIYNLRGVQSELGLTDPKYTDLLECFVFLTNKLPIQDKASRFELINKAINVTTDWLSSLMKLNSDSATSVDTFKTKYVETIRKLMTIVMGAIHENFAIIKEAVHGFVPIIDQLYKLWSFLKQVKVELFNNKVPLKNLSVNTLKAMMISLMGLIEVAEEVYDSAIGAKKEIEKKKSDLRTMNLSVEHYASMKNVTGRSWNYTSLYADKIMTKLGSFAKALENATVTIRDSFEVEEDKTNPIVEAIKAVSSEFSQWKTYRGPVLLIMGDPEQLLVYLKEEKLVSEGIVSTVQSVFKLIEMDSHKFKLITTNQTELKNYEDTLAKNFVSPIINYIRSTLEVQIEKVHGVFEKAILKKAGELLGKPELLSQMVMLMHYIMFGVTRKHLIAKCISSLYDAMKANLSKELQEFLPLVISALSGFNEDRSKFTASFEDRRTQFLHSFVKMCVPDLYPRLPLIERLVNFSLHLIKLGSSKDQLEENAQMLAEEIGALVGISSELIRGVFGIMKGDANSLITFVAPVCKIDEKIMGTLQQILSGGNKLLSSVSQETSKKEKVIDDVERSSWMSLMKKVNEGTAGIRELFELVDKEGDKSGGISVEEFSQLMEKLNMPMTTHRANEIFARCKNKNSSKSSNELDIAEFEEAVKYVQTKRITEGLHLLGISTGQLLFLFISLVIILALLFVFIFLGISAFSMGGTFGSIINSILPVGAGFAVGKNSPINFKDPEWNKRLKDVADEVIHMIGG